MGTISSVGSYSIKKEYPVALNWNELAFARKQETGPAMPVSPTKHILINSSGGVFPISVFPMTIRDECDTDFTLQVCTSITYFHICFKAQKTKKKH